MIGDLRRLGIREKKESAFHFGFCLSSSLFFRFCAVDAKFKRGLCFFLKSLREAYVRMLLDA